MFFKNRIDAAGQLLPLLQDYRNENGIVLAVPRGGVPIGHYLARHLRFPLELLLAKKLSHPAHPEYAIGAVTLEDVSVDEAYDVPESYIAQEVARIRKELKRQNEKFMAGKAPAALQGRTVIVVDDGIATGRTLKSSLAMIRNKNPDRLVVAVPVAPGAIAEEFAELTDDFVCVHVPELFFGVGGFYENFAQVPDAEVVNLLENSRQLAA